MSDAPLFDLIISGGGVNGTGIARDAAMRGLKTLMLEKKDVAAGASGANAGMIHGGIRYLRDDRKVTELSSIDSGYIQRIVPRLLFRIPLIAPLTAKDVDHPTFRERFLAYGTEVCFGVYDLYQPNKGGKPSVRLSADEVYAVEPGLRRNLIGGMSMDEWGIDAPRLCVVNALSAQRHGATVLTYHEVKGFERGAGGAIEGVRVRDAGSGQEATHRGRLVVNGAGGPAPEGAAMAHIQGRVRTGKGGPLSLGLAFSNN